jgi:hypothetical protein
MKKLVVGAGLVCAGIVVAITTVVGLASLVGLSPTLSSSSITPSAQALAAIPPDYLQTYQAAAATCPGLPWTVLAGIGEAETGQGRDTQISSAGAEGPMQFEPATFLKGQPTEKELHGYHRTQANDPDGRFSYRRCHHERLSTTRQRYRIRRR